MTYYRKITNALARSQSVHSNADMFDKRGDTWQPTEREREAEPRTVALRKRLLTPDEYAKAYGPFNPERESVKVDKRKLNEEKRAIAKFHRKQDGRSGATRDNAKLRKALARHQTLRSANAIRSVAEKDGCKTAKVDATYKSFGHFVIDTRPSSAIKDNKRKASLETLGKWL